MANCTASFCIDKVWFWSRNTRSCSCISIRSASNIRMRSSRADWCANCISRSNSILRRADSSAICSFICSICNAASSCIFLRINSCSRCWSAFRRSSSSAIFCCLSVNSIARRSFSSFLRRSSSNCFFIVARCFSCSAFRLASSAANCFCIIFICSIISVSNFLRASSCSFSYSALRRSSSSSRCSFNDSSWYSIEAWFCFLSNAFRYFGRCREPRAMRCILIAARDASRKKATVRFATTRRCKLCRRTTPRRIFA